ncbi:putative phosphoesterase (MutT family) [Thiovulum sp. ES]|nr:putative phosphoesterase (MutT family) [Thiovulum sp. ES]
MSLILVIAKSNISKLRQGSTKTYFDSMFEKPEDYISYMERGFAETNTQYLQLIPYVLLKNKDTIFSYQRSKKNSGEKRLGGKYSIGVGGHIDYKKDYDNMSLVEIIRDSALRELQEEVGLSVSGADLTFDGFVYNTDDSQGLVHLGVAMSVNVADLLDSEIFTKGETHILLNREFLTLKELEANSNRYEAWSKLLIDSLNTEKSYDN